MSRLEFPVGVSNWHLLMAQEIADEIPHCSYTKHPIKMASITGNLVVLISQDALSAQLRPENISDRLKGRTEPGG